MQAGNACGGAVFFSLPEHGRKGAASNFLRTALAENAQEIGGGTCSPMLTESRLYTRGRSQPLLALANHPESQVIRDVIHRIERAGAGTEAGRARTPTAAAINALAAVRGAFR